mgnify:FL=1|jgi:murein DD-endopeptidase MepM/ murein hydrolase activator NlpD
MNKASPAVALVAVLLIGSMAAARADDTPTAPEHVVEERVADIAAERRHDLLPFVRQIAVDGAITGSLEASTAAAGVPASAMLEVLQALAGSIDAGWAIQDGDRFHVRYEQTFTAAGMPLDDGRVLWIELRTAGDGAVALHRFRGRDKVERFWQVNGQATTPPSIRLPVEVISISSGFGLRADPFDQPPPSPTADKPWAMGGPRRPPLQGLPTGSASDTPGTGATAVLRGSQGLSSYGKSSAGQSAYGGSSGSTWQPAPRVTRSLFMHEGVDLVAPAGTPVHAAADGVVVGAGPNGRYGNWIRIAHAGTLATVYGHLAGFAPGVAAGSTVSSGDVIGYVGSTGRSTAPHLHFELLDNGKPVNPINHPETRRGALRGSDLERFGKQVAQSKTEREREAMVAAITRP